MLIQNYYFTQVIIIETCWDQEHQKAPERIKIRPLWIRSCQLSHQQDINSIYGLRYLFIQVYWTYKEMLDSNQYIDVEKKATIWHLPHLTFDGATCLRGWNSAALYLQYIGGFKTYNLESNQW